MGVRSACFHYQENTTMRLSLVTRAVLAAAVVAAIAAPVPAHAQFGKLLKKAKEKVVGDKDRAAASGPSGSVRPGEPKFDANVLELDPSLVDRMLRGMAAEARSAQSSAAKAEKINAEIAAIQKESDEIASKHPSDERAAWENTNYKVEECITDELQRRQETHEGDMQDMQARLMSDPALRQKMIEISQRASAEMQRGDSAAAQKTLAEADALTYPHAKEDSAAAKKKCGTPVPRPSWMDREDALVERRSQLADQLRKGEGVARDTALQVVAKGGGGGVGTGNGGGAGAPLTAVQYSIALERMIAWAALTAPDSKEKWKGSYSAVELDALKARDADVRKLTADMRGLGIWR